MNETLIANWNAVVGPEDEVYHLGDVAFADTYKAIQVVRRLQGRKHLIVGNHDRKNLKDHKFVELFVWVKDYCEIHYNKRLYILFHYPITSWNGMNHGGRHLYGHQHSKNNDGDLLRMDVGVDSSICSYAPINIETVDGLLESKRKRIKTGFDSYFDERMKDPEFAKAYNIERQKLK